MSIVQRALIKSLVGRGIIIGFLSMGVVACWGGTDDFSRSFPKALTVLLVLALFDIVFGFAVLAAFCRTGTLSAASGEKIYAACLRHWCFVVFLPGSPDSALVSVNDPSGAKIFGKRLMLSRKLFCGPDALSRTRVVWLTVGFSEVLLFEDGKP